MQKHEKRTHYRGKARPGRRVDLRYRKDTADSTSGVSAVTRNIGVGGAFIITDAPHPSGTMLAIEIAVPTADTTIEVSAEVRWVVSAEQEPDGAGMGVKFLDVDVEALLKLSEYFASLTGS